MTNPTEPHEDHRLRRKTAAFRLKHDVGKALRWSAPEARETNMDELRARLTRDLLGRANGGGAREDVLKIVFEWKREEGPLFFAEDVDLRALERAMAILARLCPGLSSLSDSSLLSLDAACLEAARACTNFYRRIAIDEGPETTRSTGNRR